MRRKIKLIIQREYLTRVRKKSFIIMTILGPVLMAALIIIPVWLTTLKDEEQKNIAVVDHSHSFINKIRNTEALIFDYTPPYSIDLLKQKMDSLNYYAILHIPNNLEQQPVYLYSEQQPAISLKMHIKREIDSEIELRRLQNMGLTKAQLDSTKSNISVESFTLKDGTEKQASPEITAAIGFIAALAIYMFIFIYGAMVMKGVMEEKTGRIVEVLISSVKPFELMMGKIVGIGLVALTQFGLWIVLTGIILGGLQTVLLSNMPSNIPNNKALTEQMITQDLTTEQLPQNIDNDAAHKMFVAFTNQNWGIMIFAFIFFFLGGYLLYSSLFAAIGAAVDNETETQQFMLPLTIPLILAFMMAQAIIASPDGTIAFWFSIIPFTSPIIMLMRVALDSYQMWELIVSMLLLILTFIATTWVAGKIYRVGILMYGKKVNYKELWKWLKYNN